MLEIPLRSLSARRQTVEILTARSAQLSWATVNLVWQARPQQQIHLIWICEFDLAKKLNKI